MGPLSTKQGNWKLTRAISGELCQLGSVLCRVDAAMLHGQVSHQASLSALQAEPVIVFNSNTALGQSGRNSWPIE
jgi:hypothetical protein